MAISKTCTDSFYLAAFSKMEVTFYAKIMVYIINTNDAIPRATVHLTSIGDPKINDLLGATKRKTIPSVEAEI